MSSYPVVLYVYDLSQGMARQLGPMLVGKPIEGIWHTGTIVYGSEYFFGGGIQKSAPGVSQAGQPVKVIPLGNTSRTQEEFENFLRGLRTKYNPSTYNLFNNNCNNFSDEVSQFLLGKPLPSWITGLPSELLSTPLGMQFGPMLNNMFSSNAPVVGVDMFGPTPMAGVATAQAAPAAAPPAPIAQPLPWLRHHKPLLYEAAQIPMIVKTITENSERLPAGDAGKLHDDELAFVKGPLAAICQQILTAPAEGRAALTIDPMALSVPLRLMECWPLTSQLPVIDLLRIVVLHPTFARAVCSHASCGADSLMQRFRADGTPSWARLLSARVLVNLFGTPEGASFVSATERAPEVVRFGETLLRDPKPPVRQAAASLLHNLALFASPEACEEPIAVAVKVLCDAAVAEKDPEAQYLQLRALGVFLVDNDVARAVLLSSEFHAAPFITAVGASANVIKVARELAQLLGEEVPAAPPVPAEAN